MPKIIIFSSPTSLPNEIEQTIQILNEKIFAFHVRKPEYSKSETQSYLNRIPANLHRKIVLHNHHDLSQYFNIKGVYYTRKHLSSPLFSIPKLTVSKGCHSLGELHPKAIRTYDYVFLSPVMNSISKQELHRNLFDKKQLKLLLNKNSTPIFALGGISLDNIHQVSEMGFQNFALLGSIWNSSNPIASTKKAIQSINNLKF